MSESLPASFQPRRLKEVSILFAVIATLLAFPTCLMFKYGGKGWFESFFISCFGVLAFSLFVLMIVRLQDRRQAGPVLLDLGPAPPLQGALKFSIVTQLLTGVLFMIMGIHFAQSYNLWLGGCFILAPMATLIRATGSRYQICEHGPYLSGMLIKWPDIVRFEWEGFNLWIRSNYRFLRFSDCRITVAEDRQEAVDELMRQHVAGAE